MLILLCNLPQQIGRIFVVNNFKAGLDYKQINIFDLGSVTYDAYVHYSYMINNSLALFRFKGILNKLFLLEVEESDVRWVAPATRL